METATLDALQAHFNGTSDVVRILALLSPT
jgi:hypothetical protein